MKQHSGFTLIELMIVVAIISILSTMAVPSFQDRVIRAQVQEGFNLCEFAMDAVENFYKTKAYFPQDNTSAGLPVPDKIVGNYVKSVTVTQGTLHILFGNRVNKNIDGKVISIRPAVVKDEPQVPIAWVYGLASVPEGMAVQDNNKTDIRARFLPVNARY